MFNFRKNLALGFLVLIALGIILTFWGPATQFLLKFVPLLEELPFLNRISRLPEPARNAAELVLGTLAWLLLANFIGFLFRLARLIGLFVAADKNRARRVMRVAKRIPLGILAWRLTIGVAILADALDGLPRVRMREYHGKRGFGFVTKVQRVWDNRTKEMHYEFIVYAGDFPAYFLGRWNWYEVGLCQKLLNPLRDLVATLVTVGLAAPNDLYVEKFTEEDLLEIGRRLKEKEGLLLAAGFADPDHPIVEE